MLDGTSDFSPLPTLCVSFHSPAVHPQPAAEAVSHLSVLLMLMRILSRCYYFLKIKMIFYLSLRKKVHITHADAHTLCPRGLMTRQL